MTIGKAILNPYIPAFNISGFIQPLAKRGKKMGKFDCRCTIEIPDDRCHLLGPYRERPTSDYTANNPDEISSFHRATVQPVNAAQRGASIARGSKSIQHVYRWRSILRSALSAKGARGLIAILTTALPPTIADRSYWPEMPRNQISAGHTARCGDIVHAAMKRVSEFSARAAAPM